MKWTNEPSEEWTVTGEVLHSAEFARGYQYALRDVRDAIRAVHDYHLPDLERDERDAIHDHILAMFDKGGQFEIEEEHDG